MDKLGHVAEGERMDIVRELRDFSEGPGTELMCERAADEIERLREQLAKAAAAFEREQARADAAEVRAETAQAAERERCAKLCEAEADNWRGLQDISDFKLCAARIRAGA